LMVSPALSASRAVAILDWIVGHPGETFTLSELSRATAINVPSLMSVLQSLTEAGYLARHPTRKTYEAGPSLLAVGIVVSAHHRSLEILDPELEELAAAVGTECFASVVVGDQFVVVADAGRPGSHSLPVRVGYRFPFIAPIGDVFVAWSPPAEVESWIRRADAAHTHPALSRPRLEQQLAVVRTRGYSMNLFRNRGHLPSVALDRLAERPHDPNRREMVRAAVAEFSRNWEALQPKPGSRYDVSNVSAPVFNAHGRVLMAIVLNGFTQIDGRELLAHAERLMQTTRLLTKHGKGQFPEELRHGAGSAECSLSSPSRSR
jgi:DNA-binding IclR family transcriptional regulator